jgi:transposase
VESRQTHQALKSLATHKTDRNDARGLAHLARTGFLKPVHVKSLHAHAIRSLISARKKLVGVDRGDRNHHSGARASAACRRSHGRDHRLQRASADPATLAPIGAWSPAGYQSGEID